LDYSSLVAPIRRLILAGPLLLGVWWNLGCTSSNWGSCPSQARNYPVAEIDGGAGDAGIATLLKQCQVSLSDCTPLCDELAPTGYSASVESCELVTVDGGAAVRVVWMTTCD